MLKCWYCFGVFNSVSCFKITCYQKIIYKYTNTANPYYYVNKNIWNHHLSRARVYINRYIEWTTDSTFFPNSIWQRTFRTWKFERMIYHNLKLTKIFPAQINIIHCTLYSVRKNSWFNEHVWTIISLYWLQSNNEKLTFVFSIYAHSISFGRFLVIKNKNQIILPRHHASKMIIFFSTVWYTFVFTK